MNKLFKNWTISRYIRLIIGVAIGVYAVISGYYLLLAFAILFFFQAIANMSCCCCGTGNCSSSNDSSKSLYQDEIQEYKSK